jgi:hypothetical protein
MTTVKENIKSLLQITQIVFEIKQEIESIINTQAIGGVYDNWDEDKLTDVQSVQLWEAEKELGSLSRKKYRELKSLLHKQDIEIDRIRYFIDDLSEILLKGEDND